MNAAWRAILLTALLWAGAARAQDAVEDATAWRALRDGGIALIRHATAPGIGDPSGFRLGDCSTQRNLDAVGRSEATQVGRAFRTHGIAVGAVLSSQWCRTQETAELAFPGRTVAEPIFNSFYEHVADDPGQTAAARRLIAEWKGPGALVVVTHQVNITALTGIVPASGESVVVVPDGTRIRVIGRIAATRR